MRLLAGLCVAALGWVGEARAASPLAGDWVIAAQTCPGCTGNSVVPELSGATLVITPDRYADAVIGTDACPGAPVLKEVAHGTLDAVLAQPPTIDVRGFAALLPRGGDALRVDVGCSVPALPPYTGKVLARLVFAAPGVLLRVWEDNVLLFRRKPGA